MNNGRVTIDAETTVDVSLEELGERLGEQYILEGERDERAFGFLAAIALETMNDSSYDIEDTIMEFIRNTDSIDVTLEEANEIENILR